MSEWPTATLEELCAEGGGFVRTGPFGSQLHRSDYVEDADGIPVVMPKDMVNGRVEQTSVARIDVETATRLAQHLVEPGDVILSRRGDVGRSVSIREADIPALVGTGSIRIHLGTPERMNPRYFEYFMRSRHVVDYLEGQAVGATMPNLNAGIVNSLPVFLPPREHQETTAHVLGSIDDLIEKNRRRIAVLEEMAQAIYREWFVHLRYPGHEDATFVESPLGPIPEGWKMSTCGDELTVLGGGTPSKKESLYWSEARIPWYTPTDLTNSRSRFAAPAALCINDLGLKKSSAKVFPAGSVMMTSRATLGVLSIARTEATTNQGFIVIPPDDRWPASFIYEWLDDNAELLESVATGATFKEITKGAFKKIPFLVPTPEPLAAFRLATQPIDTQIEILLDETSTLDRLLGLLLPKLVTGEIDASELDLDSLVEAGS